MNAEAMKDVFATAAAMIGAEKPTVDTVLQILARGGARDLGDRLRRAGWNGSDPGKVATHVVARAFEGLLIDAGHARYEFSWSETARLVDQNGNKVDLAELVRAAVDDPRQVSVLRQGLLGLGITPVMAPSPPDPAPDRPVPPGSPQPVRH